MLRAIEDGSGITKITTTLAGPPIPCAKLSQAVSSIRWAMFRQALAEHLIRGGRGDRRRRSGEEPRRAADRGDGGPGRQHPVAPGNLVPRDSAQLLV
ncbi:hypothetical protein GCM10023329_55580 [Streptomyces sanyensis]|uniref:Uncharacterized protein n=1 Tax=Streptomyces sanyensis TaxID=568869 RepID=A0ABP9BHM9_9ACTN